MREINTYSYIMNEAIKSNTLTNDDIKNSSLYADYWLACAELSKSIVRMNYSKTELVRAFKGWDFEDLCEEFTMVLVKKFGTQINAMLNPKPDEYGIIHAHNHNAYTTTIFTNWINDFLKKLEIKKKVRVTGIDNKEHYIYKNVTYKDVNGNEVKAYYSIMSLSTPITDDNSLTMEDTLEDDTYNPEKTYMAKNDEMTSNADSFETLKKMLKAKQYLACIYVYIEDELIKRGIGCSYETMMTLFAKAESNPDLLLNAQKALVAAFNTDLDKYVTTITTNVNNEDVRAFISSSSASDFSDFGRSFTMNDDSVYHRRDEYKRCISRIKGIDKPKKYTKKKMAC